MLLASAVLVGVGLALVWMTARTHLALLGDAVSRGRVSDLYAAFGGRSCRPEFLIVHHTALGEADATITMAKLNRIHRARGYGVLCGGRVFHVGYHYLVLQSGQVETGRPTWCRGAHAGNVELNARALGVALAGNFQSQAPGHQQWNSTIDLLAMLCVRHGISADRIVTHGSVSPRTVCPGASLRIDALRKAVSEALAMREWALEAPLPNWTNLPLER